MNTHHTPNVCSLQEAGNAAEIQALKAQLKAEKDQHKAEKALLSLELQRQQDQNQIQDARINLMSSELQANREENHILPLPDSLMKLSKLSQQRKGGVLAEVATLEAALARVQADLAKAEANLAVKDEEILALKRQVAAKKKAEDDTVEALFAVSMVTLIIQRSLLQWRQDFQVGLCRVNILELPRGSSFKVCF